MSTYLKPQSPLYNKMEDAYLYPLTTADQIIMEDGSRLDEQVAANSLSIDLNEIVSGTASPTNADMLGNVPAEEYARRMELLWENASPSSSFTAQTLKLDLTNFNFIAIDFFTAGFHKVELFEKKNQSCFVHMVASGSASTSGYKISSANRTFTIYDTGIEFDICIYSTEASDYTENNHRIIPTRIYGIKGVSA